MLARKPVGRKPAERWQCLVSGVVAVVVMGNGRIKSYLRDIRFRTWWFTWFWHKQLKGYWCNSS